MSERGGDKLNDNTVNCRVCQRPIQAKDSVDRGVGLTCVEHAPCKDIATIERRDIKYWITESYEDISTAYFLKRAGNRKLESAFFGHLATEKAIKAIVAQETNEIPPKIHDLIRLAKKARLNLDHAQRTFLVMLNQYEIEGRYPEERQKILSKTPEYLFEEILEKASEFIQWCTQQIK